jgi:hypothetical protein
MRHFFCENFDCYTFSNISYRVQGKVDHWLVRGHDLWGQGAVAELGNGVVKEMRMGWIR